MNLVGERIKKLRKERGWTQVILAEKVNVSSQVISNWERGYTNPDYDDISRLAKVFEVDSDYLLGRTNKPNNKKSSLNDHVETIELIEEEAKRMGLSPDDPVFKKMLSDAFELLRIARGDNYK